MSNPTFDLEAFKAFVAEKPADEEFRWANTDECALGQFGCPGAVAEHLGEDARDRNGVIIPFEIYDIVALSGIETFGALSSRLQSSSLREGV